MLASVSPGLAEIVNSGPVTWIGRKLKAALPDAVGAVVDGLGLEAPVTALRGKLDRATDLVGRAAKGGADGCSAFKQILGAIHDLAAEIADSAVVKAVSAGIDKVTDVLAKLAKLVAGEVFDAIREVARPVWDTLEKIGHTVGGWITSARNELGSLWGWIADKLGFGGEGESAVWAWVKGRAKTAWQGITTALAPVVGPVTTTVKTLVAFSPLGPVYALLEYGPQIVKVVSWLWEHKDNPGYITRNAHKEMAGTFLPGLLDGVGGLREKLSGAAEWLIDRVGQMATAVLDLASTVTGLPLLSGARSVLQGAADLARAFAAAVREKLTAAVDWVTSTAKRLWDIVAPYKDVLGAIALAILNPPMIPLILAGWAWRKIPPCYKPPIVDFILDIALGAISALPGVATFGPLWALLKPGIVAFLRKLKQAEDWVKEKVSNRIANIISGASPDFLLGFVKGFLQGVWEGLTDPFKAIGTAIDALNWVRDLLLGFAARALGVPAPAPTPRISAILEGKPEGNETEGGGAPPVDGAGSAAASGIAAGPPAPPRRLFKDEPAPDSSAPGAPVTGAPEAASAPGRVSEPPTPSAGDPVTAPATGGPSPAPTPGSGDLGGGPGAHPGNPAAETPPPMTPAPAPAGAGVGAPAGAAPPTAAGASAATATGAHAGAGAGASTTAPTDAPAASGSARAEADGAARPPVAASAIPPLRSREASTPPTGGSSMVQPDIAADLQGAAEELAPPMQAAAGGFWPAIKEYFASGPSASLDSLLGKLGEAWESVKGKISEAGTEVAKKVTAFFVGNQAEEQIGNATGWLAGTISFQVLLDALTAGTWTGIMGVLQQVAKFINWPMEVMGEAFKLLSKLGNYVLDGVKALRNVVKSAGGGAIRAVIEALEKLAGKFTGIVERFGGRFGRTLEKRGAGALEREGGSLAKTGAERLEQREIAAGAQRLEQEELTAGAERLEGKQLGNEAEKEAKQINAAKEEAGAKTSQEEGKAEKKAVENESERVEAKAFATGIALAAEERGDSILTALVALNVLVKPRFRWVRSFEISGDDEIVLIGSEIPILRYRPRKGARLRNVLPEGASQKQAAELQRVFEAHPVRRENLGKVAKFLEGKEGTELDAAIAKIEEFGSHRGAQLEREAAGDLEVAAEARRAGLRPVGINRPPRHHLFPKELEKKGFFTERGVDIDKYTIELDEGIHEALHGGGSFKLARDQDAIQQALKNGKVTPQVDAWIGHWNAAIERRILDQEAKLGRKLTEPELIKEARGLLRDYNVKPPPFVHYRAP